MLHKMTKLHVGEPCCLFDKKSEYDLFVLKSNITPMNKGLQRVNADLMIEHDVKTFKIPSK